MNGYKKIIKSQKARGAILNTLSFVPDSTMLSIIRTRFRGYSKKRMGL